LALIRVKRFSSFPLSWWLIRVIRGFVLTARRPFVFNFPTAIIILTTFYVVPRGARQSIEIVMVNLDSPIQPESDPKVSTPGEFWNVFLLAMFLGALGAHRFYAGKTQSAIIMLLTGGGCGIWSLIDIIMILAGMFQNQNGMVYRNPQPALSFGIFAVVLAGAVAVEVEEHNMLHPGRHANGVLPPMTHQQVQEELNSFGAVAVNTNAMLQQLFATYANRHFGRLAVTEFEGPDTNGDYTVTVHMRANYGGVQTSQYLVTLDASGTNIATWK
jgi:TM2 domain-containing membrane protein YozV